MKKFTQKTFLVLLPSIFTFTVSAQVCVPTTLIPYNTNMPGITNVTCNTINRNSLDIENGTSNSYVLTGLSTTLVKGASYSISITHTEDAVTFPGARNNVRVWIDYNNNYTLDDAGETAVSLDLAASGTSTANFTVPLTASTASVRMRVTIKMSDDAGHSLPTPCDLPADPIGYHGEIEDYTVVISDVGGVVGCIPELTSFSIYPNPVVDNFFVSYNLVQQSEVLMNIYDLAGRRVYANNSLSQMAGTHTLNYSIDDLGIDKSGIYFIELNIRGNKMLRKFIVS